MQTVRQGRLPKMYSSKSLLDAPEMILGNVLREKTGVDAVVITKM